MNVKLRIEEDTILCKTKQNKTNKQKTRCGTWKREGLRETEQWTEPSVVRHVSHFLNAWVIRMMIFHRGSHSHTSDSTCGIQTRSSQVDGSVLFMCLRTTRSVQWYLYWEAQSVSNGTKHPNNGNRTTSQRKEFSFVLVSSFNFLKLKWFMYKLRNETEQKGLEWKSE